MAEEEEEARVFYEAQEQTLKELVTQLETLRDKLVGTDEQGGE